ncbi:hypothetical protein AVEN_247966-1 [Araneus ventricosus]|uniref:Uncharacterized protein n=1 Tax=Araneus ventricosus TaxID=182803 RepID=A0A4Y2CK40_ARAVE|nr:hypothetical protein AVEN_247966-1 [Araneus ventricosus]
MFLPYLCRVTGSHGSPSTGLKVNGGCSLKTVQSWSLHTTQMTCWHSKSFPFLTQPFSRGIAGYTTPAPLQLLRYTTTSSPQRTSSLSLSTRFRAPARSHFKRCEYMAVPMHAIHPLPVTLIPTCSPAFSAFFGEKRTSLWPANPSGVNRSDLLGIDCS